MPRRKLRGSPATPGEKKRSASGRLSPWWRRGGTRWRGFGRSSPPRGSRGRGASGAAAVDLAARQEEIDRRLGENAELSAGIASREGTLKEKRQRETAEITRLSEQRLFGRPGVGRAEVLGKNI